MRKWPSVLGGYRPQVRDPGRDAFAAVQYCKAEVEQAEEVLARKKNALAKAEAARAEMRKSCRKCGKCSACIG